MLQIHADSRRWEKFCRAVSLGMIWRQTQMWSVTLTDSGGGCGESLC